jgi:hypothetical protein
VIKSGDLLIMRGPREGEVMMREICGDVLPPS